MQCTQGAGDVLFIPSSWGHATVNAHPVFLLCHHSARVRVVEALSLTHSLKLGMNALLAGEFAANCGHCCRVCLTLWPVLSKVPKHYGRHCMLMLAAMPL